MRREHVRGDHRRGHRGARAAGARRRRGARGCAATRPPRCTTSAPSAASRPACCPRRRTRTRCSTSSACNAARRRGNLAFAPKLVRATQHGAPPAARAAAAGRRVGGRLRQPARGAGRRRPRIPVVVVSFDRRPGRASALTARFAAASAVAFDGLAVAACRGDRRAGAAGDPRRRPGGRPRGRARRPRPARRPLRRRGDRRVARFRRAQRGDAGYRRRPRRRRRPGGPPRRRGALRRRPSPTVGDAGRAASTTSSASSGGWTCCTPPPTCSSGAAGATTVAEVAVTGTPAMLVPWAGGGRGPPDRQRPLAGRPGRRRCTFPRRISAASAALLERAARPIRQRLAELGQQGLRRRGERIAAVPSAP